MSEDLKSFTIQSRVGQRVDRPAGRKSATTGDTPSVGFPRIEALVEASQPDLSGLDARHAALVSLAREGSAKEKPPAARAALAYERTRDLIDHLLQTKAQISGS